MGELGAFLKIARADTPERAPAERVGDHREFLLALVSEHYERTASAVAGELLEAWDASRFLKVMPHDYKRALSELGDEEIRYDDAPLSSGGAGFVTKESEAAA